LWPVVVLAGSARAILFLDKRTLRWVIQLYPSNSGVQMPCLICAGLVLAFCSALLSGCAVPHAASVDASTAGLPQIIAHRGGTGDAPENTLEAIRLALEHHADAMWLTVQLSKDGVPVLYRPADLAALTDSGGPVLARTAAKPARMLLNEGCIDAPAEHTSAAFELHRTVTVVEKFTLGEGRSEVNATLWTPATVACFRQRPDVHLVAIAVNNADDYRAAACLGMDAVLSDSPVKMAAIRAGIRVPLRCAAGQATAD
jgi:glycerophosphoryl diester phosphodiesterase